MKILLLTLILFIGCATEPQDCNGDYGGDAQSDICGICTLKSEMDNRLSNSEDMNNDGYNDSEIELLFSIDSLGCVETSSSVGYGYNIATNWESGYLTHLTLNNLSEIGYSFNLDNINVFDSLKSLTFNFNFYETLPDSICDLSNLEILTLWDNSISTLPECLGELSKLNSLTLKENKLTSLNSSIISLEALEVLNLSNNQFTSIPTELFSLGKLNNLHLHDNFIVSIPEDFCLIYPNLNSFDIFNNYICGELPSCLTQLDIGNQNCSPPTSL